MHPGLQVQEHRYSSSESTVSLPHRELNAMGKTSSQDQCASSAESVHDEGKPEQHMTSSAMFVCNPELSINVSQAEIGQPMVQYPYAYPDPYLSGLFTAYGPHAMFQPQVMGAAAGRIPLPADIPEDGPIYVNAKQYHGILRRRQTRAKLEAQNKLVKNRRPYLHESRHQHALSRVRGTGGRFLSTKKGQHTESHPPTSSQNSLDHPFHFNQMGNTNTNMSNHHAATSTAEGATVSSADAGFHIFMQGGGGGLVYNQTRHYASSSVVR